MGFRKGRKGRSEHAERPVNDLETSSYGPFAELLALLTNESAIESRIDAPVDPKGPWWLDVTIDGHAHTVVWKADEGFGLFASDVTFGEHPDGVFTKPEDVAARLLQLTTQRAKRNSQSPMSLRDLRHLVGRNQKEVATTLRKAQSAISKIELGGDPKFSTVREYISAMGGELVLTASFPDFKAPITVGGYGPPSTNLEPIEIVKKKAVRRAA